MPIMSTVVNIRCAYLNMQVSVLDHPDRAFLVLGAIESFYSVEWPYLWANLDKFGFGSIFLPEGLPVVFHS